MFEGEAVQLMYRSSNNVCIKHLEPVLSLRTSTGTCSKRNTERALTGVSWQDHKTNKGTKQNRNRTKARDTWTLLGPVRTQASRIVCMIDIPSNGLEINGRWWN